MASKWADYCISAVKYNSTHTHIDKVKVHQDLGESLSSSTTWTRSQVVTALAQGSSFVTVTKGSDGKWKKGQEVHVVSVNGVNYIRTDRNARGSDNLTSLPEF